MNENFWHDLRGQCPERAGRYLVVQQTDATHRYRWVRYWDGNDWPDSKEAQYGPITHWGVLPDYPRY